MGYRSVLRVPRCFSHAEAKRIHDNSAPVRGRDKEIRPLGERRYVDSYSVRMGKDNAVELVLYQTPVVTFKPNDDIIINPDGWVSVSTRQFIQQVLGLSCYSRNGKMIIEVNGEKHLCDKPLTVRRQDGKLVVTDGYEARYGYRLNRKAANNVRARYKEFIQYFKGFLALRSIDASHLYGKDARAIEFQPSEVARALGVVKASPQGGFNGMSSVGLHLVDNEKFGYLATRPAENWVFKRMNKDAQWQNKRDELVNKYQRVGEEFFGYISSGDHEQFYKAAMIMVAFKNTLLAPMESNIVSPERTKYADVNTIERQFNNILMKWHADEVLEKFQLAPDKLANPAYDDWFVKE